MQRAVAIVLRRERCGHDDAFVADGASERPGLMKGNARMLRALRHLHRDVAMDERMVFLLSHGFRHGNALLLRSALIKLGDVEGMPIKRRSPGPGSMAVLPGFCSIRRRCAAMQSFAVKYRLAASGGYDPAVIKQT
jgi:hypothetical protein